MRNYQKLHYEKYRIMLSDGSSIVTTRKECFSIEPDSENCPFKQRWYYSPDQYMAVRLPRNELGERLGKDNAADLKAQERLLERNRERNLEIDAYTTEDGTSLDIPATNVSVEDTAIMKAELNAIHKAISELPDDLKDLCEALLREEKQCEIAARNKVTDAAIRKRIKKLRTILLENEEIKNYFENL